MCTKKRISSLCKLYSVYEEIPEEFLDETDVDSYFYHNTLDKHFGFQPPNSSSEQRIQQKVFGIQSYSNDLFSRKKSAFPKRKLSYYSTVWVNFSKLLIKPTKYRRFHFPNLNLRLDLQKQKTKCSVNVTRIWLSI